MSTLDAIWLVSASSDLTDDEKIDTIAHLKASEWSDLTVPVTIGTITITDVLARGALIRFEGTGGTLDWPLELVNPPIAVADPDGPDMDPNGQRWRVDCFAILANLLGAYQ